MAAVELGAGQERLALELEGAQQPAVHLVDLFAASRARTPVSEADDAQVVGDELELVVLVDERRKVLGETVVAGDRAGVAVAAVVA